VFGEYTQFHFVYMLSMNSFILPIQWRQPVSICIFGNTVERFPSFRTFTNGPQFHSANTAKAYYSIPHIQQQYTVFFPVFNEGA
jgi:hypothetical protein